MINVHEQVKNILDTVGVAVRFYHPDETAEMPVISYYEVGTSQGFGYDNAERSQDSRVSVDIWAKSPKDTAELAVRVDSAMQNGGWQRDLSMDIPPDDGVYHKAMRFRKNIFY